jgi:hypothetical protein
MESIGSAALMILALLLLSACPPLIYLVAGGLQKVVWALRAHADATGEYVDAFRRQYQRRAES